MIIRQNNDNDNNNDNKSGLAIFIVFILILIVMSGNDSNTDSSNVVIDNSIESTIESVDKNKSEEVYEFMQENWDEYEKKYGVATKESEVALAIKTSQTFNINIVEVFTIYDIEDRKAMNMEQSLSEEELIKKNEKYCKNLGFKKKNDKWYYENIEVEDVDLSNLMK